jgi:hypothetical protein
MIDRVQASWYGPRALRRPRFFPQGALALRLGAAVPLFCSLVSMTACGPIEYINQVSSKAASAVVSAKLAQADHYAPYEYTAAEEYLHKAREEAGYAQYQDAIEYGRRAEELANRARAISVARLSQSTPVTPSMTATPATELRDVPRPETPSK